MSESSDIPLPRSEGNPRRPGGEYKPKPLEIGGVFYDGLYPPKIIRRPDGSEVPIGGQRLDKDQVDQIYAERFWQSSRVVKGTREVMIDNIHRATEQGSLGSFVDPNGITEQDKEKLSAYRQLAKELGYEVGDFKFDKAAHTALAPIHKASTQQK